jgi:AcrR family transcriptional regulator
MATDVRVTVTKKILKDSLLQLMQTTNFDKITIKDICTISGVSRSTFYSHYEDIFSLLADFEKDIFEAQNLNNFMKNSEEASEMSSLNLVEILKQVDANADFYKIYLNNMHAGYLTDAIQRLSHGVIDYWMQNNFFRDRTDAKYAFLFYKSGIIEVVKEWLDEPEDTRKTPKELADSLSMIMSINLEIIT